MANAHFANDAVQYFLAIVCQAERFPFVVVAGQIRRLTRMVSAYFDWQICPLYRVACKYI